MKYNVNTYFFCVPSHPNGPGHATAPPWVPNEGGGTPARSCGSWAGPGHPIRGERAGNPSAGVPSAWWWWLGGGRRWCWATGGRRRAGSVVVVTRPHLSHAHTHLLLVLRRRPTPHHPHLTTPNCAGAPQHALGTRQRAFLGCACLFSAPRTPRKPLARHMPRWAPRAASLRTLGRLDDEEQKLT